MTKCNICDADNVADNDFCIECGNHLVSSTPNNMIEKQKIENESISSKKSRLIFPDLSVMEIDQSHRLVGRVNLRKFSKNDPSIISRGQFTVYQENKKCYLKDGRTNVQEKPSANHTLLNDEDISGKEKCTLKDGDEILVSDVKVLFKEED